MKFDIIANYDSLMRATKDTNSFITDSEEADYIQVAYAVDSLVKYGDKVSLINIKIITDIPTKDLLDFMDFILSCEQAALIKYK